MVSGMVFIEHLVMMTCAPRKQAHAEANVNINDEATAT